MTIGQSQLERAIQEIQHRANVPQLDFTQHQLDNGYTISTRERVVKEVRRARFSLVCGEGPTCGGWGSFGMCY